MEEYGKILLIAMPIFLVLVLLEKLYGYLKGSDTVPLDDAVSSLSSGMTNVLKDVLGLSIGIISYEWLFSKLAIFSIENTVVVYAIAFIAIDFYGYWSHRFAHKVNLFWNHHVIHHSSEEFNLACALRQPISGIFKFYFFADSRGYYGCSPSGYCYRSSTAFIHAVLVSHPTRWKIGIY